MSFIGGGGSGIAADIPRTTQQSEFEDNVQITIIGTGGTGTPKQIATNWIPKKNDNFLLDTYLKYTGLSGTFTVGQTVTATPSGASGTIISDTGSVLTVRVPFAPALNFNAVGTPDTLTEGSASATLSQVSGGMLYTAPFSAHVMVYGQCVLNPTSASLSTWTLFAARNGNVESPGAQVTFVSGANIPQTLQVQTLMQECTSTDVFSFYIQRDAGDTDADIILTDGRMNAHFISKL